MTKKRIEKCKDFLRITVAYTGSQLLSMVKGL